MQSLLLGSPWVPSLYVRVYRRKINTGADGSSSLTIREGVSRSRKTRTGCGEFPHYTWGCIIFLAKTNPSYPVPSLYVRVYLPAVGFSLPAVCSLTIREGVSTIRGTGLMNETFPHYTWGCIIWFFTRQNKKDVPSLYVRVYRRFKLCVNFGGCSLTIREGVSSIFVVISNIFLFPHYTWGCIVWYVNFLICLIVPSLYVRVYRQIDKNRFYVMAFPHYTWGCIL